MELSTIDIGGRCGYSSAMLSRRCVRFEHTCLGALSQLVLSIAPEHQPAASQRRPRRCSDNSSSLSAKHIKRVEWINGASRVVVATLWRCSKNAEPIKPIVSVYARKCFRTLNNHKYFCTHAQMTDDDA
ncbi:hypothetical protein L596_004623 [Steinernema carpocapsae]|uniref:Uncharacterized protein n=1 Tax=Steinernema carpocapsae TaxID=34508 RepID=A0A4V6I8D0_STECR|nr:hypothetical protein L596_004623 [Steinernema carpocapsae]